MKIDALDFSALQSALSTDRVMANFTMSSVDALTESVSSLAVDVSLKNDASPTMKGMLIDVTA